MSESVVVAETKVVREAGFHYFVQGTGVVKQDRKTKEKVVVAADVFTPEKGFFYFLNNDGNVAKTVRVSRGKKATVPAVPAPEVAV